MIASDVAKISPKDLFASFRGGVKNLVALSMELNLPIAPAVPYMI